MKGILLSTAVLAIFVSSAYATGGTSVAPEIMNQSKAVASVITSRINVLWSDYVDKQLEYTNHPSTAEEPKWADENELEDLVGGTAPEGITFAERNMPAERNDSFNLEVTVGPQFGGAASTRYIRAFLPTATVEGNVITVPVTRPSKALGLADLQIKKLEGVEKFTMAPGADIEMNGGDLTGVGKIEANNIDVSNKITTYGLEVTDMLQGNKADFSGDVSVDGKLTVGPNGSNGHIYLGGNGYIHGGTNSNLTIGGSTNTSKLANLIVNAAVSQFNGRIKAEDIQLVKNGVTTTIGSTDSSGFTINSTQPILLSQSGQAIMQLAQNQAKINAPLTLKGHLMPAAHNAYDIGSTGMRWRNIYASGRFFGNVTGDVTGNVYGNATGLSVGKDKNNPYGLNVTWAKQATSATTAASATTATNLTGASSNVSGVLYANKGVMAKATGTKMRNGWNQVYGVNTASNGAFHNPTGGAFVGLHPNANIYFGQSTSATSGQYYGYVNSGGYYNGSGQRLATEAFVSGSYATKSYVDTKVSGSSHGGERFWRIPGTYSWTVPSGVSRIVVTTVGGGGGGGVESYYGGSRGYSHNAGGCGGEVIVDTQISVSPGKKLLVTVGKGGTGYKTQNNKTTEAVNGGVSFVSYNGSLSQAMALARGGASFNSSLKYPADSTTVTSKYTGGRKGVAAKNGYPGVGKAGSNTSDTSTWYTNEENGTRNYSFTRYSYGGGGSWYNAGTGGNGASSGLDGLVIIRY